MSIALSALSLFALLLPGFLLYYGYVGGFRRSPEAIIASQTNITWGLAGAVISSAILHAFGVTLVDLYFQYPVNLDAVLFLVGGHYDDHERYANTISSITSHPLRILTYFLVLFGMSAGVGVTARRAIRRWRLDKRFSFLKIPNEWHYLFTGEGEDEWSPNGARLAFVRISATIEQGNCSYLYMGVLAHYQLSAGYLDWISLRVPFRRELSKDLPPGDRDGEHALLDDRYYPLKSDYVVLSSEDIKSIGVDYFYEDDSELAQIVETASRPTEQLAN